MPSEKLTDEAQAGLEAIAHGVPPELAERHAAHLKEWGTWVATQDIPYGGVMAYRAGDAVPAANVEKHHYDQLGWVARRDTKAAQAVTEEN